MPSMNPLEEYLTDTFSKIKDQYGQNLNITPALPTLIEVLKGTEQPNKKVSIFFFFFTWVILT